MITFIALTLLAQNAAARSAAPRGLTPLEGVECWQGNVYMENEERYIRHAGIISVEDCDARCLEQPGCDVVMQYRYPGEPARASSCFLMRDLNCSPGTPPENWVYRAVERGHAVSPHLPVIDLDVHDDE